jgi:hypothetical protein
MIAEISSRPNCLERLRFSILTSSITWNGADVIVLLGGVSRVNPIAP